MKKRTLLNILNEDTDKTKITNMNDDSFYDGHKFVEYGKNIQNINLIPPSNEIEKYSIDKEKLSITWGVKFQFRNSGIEGAIIDVLNLEAKLITTSGGTKQETPINFGEYVFSIIKEKNPEIKDVQISIESIEIDLEQKLVNIIVSI